MLIIRAKFEDGNEIKTEINGTIEKIKNYYINKYFNFGIDSDLMIKCIEVEIIGGL